MANSPKALATAAAAAPSNRRPSLYLPPRHRSAAAAACDFHPLHDTRPPFCLERKLFPEPHSKLPTLVCTKQPRFMWALIEADAPLRRATCVACKRTSQLRAQTQRARWSAHGPKTHSQPCPHCTPRELLVATRYLLRHVLRLLLQVGGSVGSVSYAEVGGAWSRVWLAG